MCGGVQTDTGMREVLEFCPERGKLQTTSGRGSLFLFTSLYLSPLGVYRDRWRPDKRDGSI